VVIASSGERPILLVDVAEVRDGIAEQRSLAFIDGTPAIALDVLKQSGANTVGVVEALKTELRAIEAELPPGTHVDVVRDGSVFIREAVTDVEHTLVIGGFLTVLIVFCFLNSWRSTVITGLTLPISVISSFIVMNFAGMTLNVMTLMALSLAIGLLIDDAIVVRENIVRHLERGQDHMAAARDGTSEIGLAVMATTFSIIAVFVPVAFMKGIVGRFFFEFGITVAFAVLVSLFVSFTLDPMLSSRWVDPDIDRTRKRHLAARALDRFNAWFDRTADSYRRGLGWVLAHRPATVALALAAFLSGIVAMGFLESEFFPGHDRGEFEITFRTAPGASIEETRDRVGAVLGLLEGVPEVERTYASIAARDGDTVRDARVYVKLVDKAGRARTQDQIQRHVRGGLYALPGIAPSVMEAGRMDNRKPLMVNISGEDLPTLKGYAARIKEELYGVPGIVDLEVTLEHDAPEYRLWVDRERASDVGVDTALIARTVGALVGGQAVSTFEDETGEAREVRVRLAAASRQDAAQVERLRLAVARAGAPALVTLADVAHYRLGTTPSEINRRDLSREVVVSANLDDVPLGTAVAAVRAATSRLELAPGYRVSISGESEDMEESFGYMLEALVLAIVFVYLILAAQFESFVDPLAIMLSLPLSIVGMAGMLLLTGDTINIMSLIGLIMLMGLVTKNAILLVDFAKVLRSRGLSRRDALVEAGRTRLRPIVMTTVAMIFGMLPLAFAIGSGAEMRAPMARAVIGGLITSTLLTLLVVPVVYSLLDDLTAWARRHRHGVAHAARGAAGVLVLALALTAGAVPAAGQPAGVKVVTLDEALAIAAGQNADVRKAVEYQNWVRARYVEERSAALPHLEIAGGLTHAHDESQRGLFRDLDAMVPGAGGSLFPMGQDVRTAGVRVSQVIYTWGQIGAAIRAAKIGVSFSDAQLRRFRQTVARDVAVAFYDVLAARELRAILEETVTQRERHLEEARRKHLAGIATDYDVLAADVALDNARPDAIRAENAVRTARARLRFLLGGTDDEVDVAGTLEARLEATPPYEDALARALRQRPDLEQIGHQLGIYEQLAAIAGAGNKPRLDLRGGYGRRSLGVRDIDTNGLTWDLGVYLSFPVFDGFRTDGRVAQARSDVARVRIERAQLRDAVALEVRTAVDAVHEAAEIAKAISGTVRQAERLLAMAEKGYELGVKTNLDVQDALLNARAARASLARAQRDYLVADATLRWVCGDGGP
jgi:hydrophobic/amphiphilic exporter-1 (mainly G- bacteria), HAE1 family